MNFTEGSKSNLLDHIKKLRMYDLSDWILFDLVAVVLFVIFIMFPEVTWKKQRNRLFRVGRKLTEKDIPGPFPLPIIGTRWIYFQRYKMSKIHEAYKDMFKRYGKIIKEEALWNFPIISIRAKDDIEKVFRQTGKYPLRPPTEVIAHYRSSRPDRYTSMGIINEQGEEWHRLRNGLTHELTSSKTMTRLLPELNNVAYDFTHLLSQSIDKETEAINSFDEFACRLGLESSCSVILGRRLGFLERQIDPLAQRLAGAVKDQLCAARDTYYGLPIWKVYETAAYKKFIASEETIYDVISEMVDKAEKQEEDTIKEESTEVFMSILKAPGLDIKDKKAGIIDFIAAGIKTIENSLVLLLYLIAKNENCQTKLREEIARLAPNNAPIESSTIRDAHYLRACIMESFRVLPTAPCVARILETDMELSGYHLRAGSVVLCHTWRACMEENNFTCASEFQPERWLNNTGVNQRFLVAPFGMGRRMCPGKRFVELELSVTLAHLVRRFEINFDGELELDFEFLLSPHTPAKFKFKEII